MWVLLMLLGLALGPYQERYRGREEGVVHYCVLCKNAVISPRTMLLYHHHQEIMDVSSGNNIVSS